jgi:predicted metal-binding membrane protein
VSVSPTLVEVLKRDRAVVAFGLAGVVTLSWTYLIYMDWRMRHMDVGMEMAIMPAMQRWTAWDLVLVFLMGLLFAFGVMNLLWVACISAFVLLEKITTGNRLVSRLSGLLFVAWAAWIVLRSYS